MARNGGKCGCDGFAAAYAGRPQYCTSARCCLPLRRRVTFHLEDRVNGQQRSNLRVQGDMPTGLTPQ